MKKALTWLDRSFEEFVITVLLAYFVCAAILQVLFRFVFQIPGAWTEETARYAFIWLMFVGSAEAVKKGSHIRVDILDTILKTEKRKKILSMFSDACLLLFAAVSTCLGAVICIKMTGQTQNTPVLGISFIWVYLSLPVGMGLTCFRIVQKFLRKKNDAGKNGLTESGSAAAVEAADGVEEAEAE